MREDSNLALTQLTSSGNETPPRLQKRSTTSKVRDGHVAEETWEAKPILLTVWCHLFRFNISKQERMKRQKEENLVRLLRVLLSWTKVPVPDAKCG